MDFFNKLGNMASETYKKTSKKTGELAKEAKIRMKMNEDKGKIKDLYQEIGKIVYQKHIKNEEISIQEDLNSYCMQIDELSNDVEKALDDILKLRGKRICENCNTEIDINVKFCPSCGKEQPEIPEEVKEDKDDTAGSTDKEQEVTEAEIVKEDKNNS